MTLIKVYREDDANAVVIDDGSRGSGGMRFTNELRAIGNGDGTASILSPTRSTDSEDFAEVASVAFANYCDESGAQLGSDEAATVNALNAILRHTGGPDGEIPVITSATSLTVTDGDPVNYTLTADYGVAYEWANIPTGLAAQNGNTRKLIGTIADGAGTYNLTMPATNYYGQDTETLTITVNDPPYTNTKSIEFENQDWMGANASQVDATLGRSGNGSGASDAWSIGLLYNASTATQAQTIVYFGDADAVNGGSLSLSQISNASGTELRFRYGSNNNRLQMTTTNGALTSGAWSFILLTYDGGTTGASSAEIGNYYSRFKIYVNGNLQPTSNSHANYGWSGAIDPDNFRLGRFTQGNYLRNDAKIDELALWNSDQSANVSDIYNGGTTHDLELLTTPPVHYWRMGDGKATDNTPDAYPNIQDTIGNVVFVMNNMTAADIVNDVP